MERGARETRGVMKRTSIEIPEVDRAHMRTEKASGSYPWVRMTPWRRAWRPTSVLLPRKSHRQRSLVGYSSLGLKASGITKVT